ncbi:uncharacterized protein LOC143426390 [Xylocopa sonorina]|uniref:uncharacterized protein LOC143426390 n=1 Tax=Xylocopa sonorina TaxID=1818115 RepID=UPI00403AA720
MRDRFSAPSRMVCRSASWPPKHFIDGFRVFFSRLLYGRLYFAYLSMRFVKLVFTYVVEFEVSRLMQGTILVYMQQEDDYRSQFTSCNVTPQKVQRTPRIGSSSKKDVMPQDMKCKLHSTPCNSPNKCIKNPQSSGNIKKLHKSQSESNKRRNESSHAESFEKMRKISSSGNFINTLIGQWSKRMGTQAATLSQSTGAQESPMVEEIKQIRLQEEQKVRMLQKKLQVAEETISSLSSSYEAEVRTKEEILQQLNGDWESITKYYYEISESLKGFQQHKDNLTKMFNDIITMQEVTVKKLQEELNIVKLKDEEHKSIVRAMENQAINQEKRIQEIVAAEAELKKELEDVKNKIFLEKNDIHNAYAEEKLELMKKQENLASTNQKLQEQLQNIMEEKQKITTTLANKNDTIENLQTEIVSCKNKMETLLCQNAEISAKYEKLVDKQKEILKESQSKGEEIDRLRENLNARLIVESGLASDVNTIQNKYNNLHTNLAKANNKLKEVEILNLNLEKSLKTEKFNSEQKVMELNTKITLLEQEKERVFAEKNSKIQDLENYCKLLEEKHKTEISSLKKKFNDKKAELKTNLSPENFAFVKLNETVLSKVNKENQNRETNYYNDGEKDFARLKKNLKEFNAISSFVDSNLIQTTKKIGSQTQTNQIHKATEQQQFQNQEELKKNLSTDSSLNIFDFTTTEINDELQNISRQQDKDIQYNFSSSAKDLCDVNNYSQPAQDKNITESIVQTEQNKNKKKESKKESTPKKKIFKTRNSGVQKCTLAKSTPYGFSGKLSKK